MRTGDTNDAEARDDTRTALGAAALFLLALFPFNAGAVDFESAVTVTVVHTDNLTQTAVNRESETLLQVAPQFRLAHVSRRLAANADYRLDAYHFDQRSDQELRHRFDGDLRYWAAPELFYVAAGARRMHTMIDPEGAVPFPRLPDMGNLADRDEYYVEPGVSTELGSNLSLAASLRRTWIGYDRDETDAVLLSDYHYDRGAFSLDNYRRGHGFTFALRSTLDKLEHDAELPPYEYRSAVAELGFWATRTTRVFAAGGLESAWDAPTDPSLEDSLWEVGLATELGSRLVAELAAGERSFGSSRRGQLDLLLQRGRLGVSYAETPVNTGMNRFTGGQLRPEEPTDFLFDAATIERYIAKTLRADLAFDLRRLSVLLAAFDETRVERTLGDGTPLEDELQKGSFATIGWRIGLRTELLATGGRVRRSFTGADRRLLRSASIGANYRPGPRVSLAFLYERWRESTTGDSAATPFPGYSANAWSLAVTRTF